MQPSVELSPPFPLPPQLVQLCPLSLTPYPAQRVHSLNVYSVIIMSLGWFGSQATVVGVDHATKPSAVGLTPNRAKPGCAKPGPEAIPESAAALVALRGA